MHTCAMLACVLFPAVVGQNRPSGGSGDVQTLVILHTNDFHGRHQPVDVLPGDATSQTGGPDESPQVFARAGCVGGCAWLADAVKRARRQHGASNVLLVHAGDTFSDDLLGNLTRGEAMIRLMNALGYQFAALGNHDFDYGRDRTEELASLARFPMRAANVIEERTDRPFLGNPTLIAPVGGLRVGLLALGYHNTPLTTREENLTGLRFVDGVAAVQARLPGLRRQCDVVVVVSHLGTEMDEVLAREVDGIDVIIGGHSHDVLRARRGGRTWIAQALSNAAMLGETRVTVVDGRVTNVTSDVHILWHDLYQPDPEVQQLVDELRAPHKARLEEVIGHAAARITRQYKSPSPFDRLVGEILRSETGASIALLPGVGYGVSLGPGDMTREQLYTLLPHPVRIVTLELRGAQIAATLEQSATNLRPVNPREIVGGLIQTSGLTWQLDLSQPLGRRVSEICVGGRPLDRRQWYDVVTHTGMLAGIHNYEEITRGRNVKRLDRQVVDAVEASFQTAGPVRLTDQGP